MSGEMVDIVFVVCDCCGLTEECTPSYIVGVRARYGGRWLCGLCAEAVNDEISRCGPLAMISSEEAMLRHESFCRGFRSPTVEGDHAVDPSKKLISTVRQILRRSLDGQRVVRSMPNSPRSEEEEGLVLARAGSCVTIREGQII